MNLGDAYLLPPEPGLSDHLYIVLSHDNGYGRVVVANFSSSDDGLGDLSEVQAREHPWLRHQSFIRADKAQFAVIQALEHAVTAGFARKHDVPAGHALITKMQDALIASRHTARDIKLLLRDQGFGPKPRPRVG